MKFITKIITGGLVFGALVGVYFADDYYTKVKTEKENQEKFALSFNTEDCLKFSMQNKNGSFVFERFTSDSPWKMISPKTVDADMNAVNSLLNNVSQIAVQKILTSADDSIEKKSVDYGLKNAPIRFEVILKNKKQISLSLGNDVDSRAEKNMFRFPSVYAAASNRKNVLIVDNSSLNFFNEKKLSDLRSKQISLFDPSRIYFIDVKASSGDTSLERKSNKWSVALVKKSEASDDEYTTSYLNLYKDLVASEVIEEQQKEKITTQAIDLTKPAAHVSFFDKNHSKVQDFDLFIAKNGVYLSMTGGAYGKVDLAKWPDLVPKSILFRNREFMLGTDFTHLNAIKISDSTFFIKNDKGWYKNSKLENPSQSNKKLEEDIAVFVKNLEFVKADDIVDNVPDKDLINYGLHKPLKTLSLVYDSRFSNQKVDILIGNRVPHNEKSVYVRRSDSNAVYVLSGDWLTRASKLYAL